MGPYWVWGVTTPACTILISPVFGLPSAMDKKEKQKKQEAAHVSLQMENTRIN
ncbi:hypothetical protein CJ030_MR1G014939 [Morella rubra]|uniref:Uncharacterized protein n=1 Tax=Morella rubra TaxID=262757 RepID=A0A6A1WP32_9ROSI|nr:hypothetical protein CJ030_MR1G014939 [Morella rubra]